jgi:serine/threonine protein kinase
MTNLASATIIDLDLFEVDQKLITESRGYQVFDGYDRRTGNRVTVKTATLVHPIDQPLRSKEDRLFLREYFREISNLVYSIHPSTCQLVGWNVRLGKTESKFTIITKYTILNSIETYPNIGVALSPTSRQIVLYGVARCLRWFDKEHLSHQDIQPSTISRDERGYPILLRVGQPSYEQNESGEISGGNPKYIAPSAYRGLGSVGMDEFSFGSLFYLLTEDKEPIPDGCGDEPEAIAAAVREGIRPRISTNNQYAELIEQLWEAGNGPRIDPMLLLLLMLGGQGRVPMPRRTEVIQRVVTHFNDPSNLLPGVNLAEFYTYRGWLEYGEANLRKPPESPEFIRKVCQRPNVYEEILDTSRDLTNVLGALVAWFDSSNKAVDENRRQFLLPILTRRSTFDAWTIFKPEERPLVQSVFTSAVQDPTMITDDREVSDALETIFYECKVPDWENPVVLKKVLIPHDGFVEINNIIRFFREVFSLLYIQHPAFHRMIGWNIKTGSIPFEFCLLTEKMETQGLTLALVRSFTGTQRTIMLYGIARGMAYLHSLKIVHRDLGFGSIMVDSENRPRIGNLWYAKGEAANVAETFFEQFSLYRASEIIEREKFTFESDVYAYAILAYEIIEERTASLGNLPISKLMDQVKIGNRPAWDKATKEPRLKYLQELVMKMWDNNQIIRPTFQKIVHKLEDSRFWFPDTDATALFLYKGYLDASEKLIESDSIVPAKWIRQVSRLRQIQPWMEKYQEDLIRIIIRVLCHITIGSDASSRSQRQQLKQLLRSSFEQTKCIDGIRFRDYAFRYLSGVSIDDKGQVVIPPRTSQGFSLNPLTGSIFDCQNLKIDPRPMAAGTFGKIYKASQVETENKVREFAVKKLTPSLKVTSNQQNDPASESKEICNTFREIITQMYCQHPAVVQFYGWNYCKARAQEPAQIVLVSLFMDEGTLGSRLVRQQRTGITEEKKLSDTEKMICLYGIARALAWAHSRGIIHRDVKSENFFLDSKKHPRVADFGLAKMHLEGIEMSTNKAGSMPYMAPEILAQDGRWSFTADVYAYAIVFWEVVTGSLYESPKFQLKKLSDQNDEGPGRPPLNVIPKQEHRTLLTRMWSWQIENRPKFGSIAELLERREYWLPNTEGPKFLRYVDGVKR